MKTEMNRRGFLAAGATATAIALSGCASSPRSGVNTPPPGRRYGISLAEWSYNKALFGRKMSHLDFPAVARSHGIGAIELVNQFFMDRAQDRPYLDEFRRRADGEGTRILLIMCDDEGALGDVDPARRRTAVDNHRKWADAARHLGCHSIRVNAEAGDAGSPAEKQARVAEGLRALTEHCAELGLNCIVENHGGLASDGQWLVGLMRRVDHPRAGLLPDFGNWYEYDRYRGVADMMPWAKAASAKSHDFDAEGNCRETDYRRMLRIVLDGGYHGHLGIEYEGEHLPEAAGVDATRRLLERLHAEFA